MKTTKPIILLLIIILSNNFLFAQQRDLSPEQLKIFLGNILLEIPYVFEGKVIKQQIFKGANNNILTCSVIDISKIFKGSPQIKLGTIKVMTSQGGYIEGENLPLKSSFGSSGIYVGDTYIVFGILDLEIDSIVPFITNNTIKINLTDCPMRILNMEEDDSLEFEASWREQPFKTVIDLYTYLKDNGGLTIQEQVVEPSKK